jgi:two-component system sensor histidine kinase CiaH
MVLNEEKVIHNQLIKNIIYNFLIFSVIFTLFGILIFNTVKYSVYESSNRELNSIKEKILSVLDSKNVSRLNIFDDEKKLSLVGIQINPRVTYILRDEEGNILNTDSIGRIYSEYGESISFDKSKLNSIYETVINNTYTYRGVNIKVIQGNGQIQYIQLLVNVDSEKAIIDNYLNILIIGIGITIILSLIASYVISKKSLEPIVNTWRKQTEFVQNASHELRTPLTIIQTKQELLLQEPDKKIIDKSEDIMLTLNEAKRLSKMTKDLMLLANADSNRVEITKEEVKFDDFINNIAMPYIDFATMEDKTINLDLNYKDTVKIDVNKFHQLIVILLDNAIKYTKQDDTITIHTYSKEGKCVVEVKDTGIGISDDGIKHVFERFYREDKARSRKTGGTGLGLSIAEYIVALHKGSIKISHNEPKGTIVTVKLPKN